MMNLNDLAIEFIYRNKIYDLSKIKAKSESAF